MYEQKTSLELTDEQKEQILKQFNRLYIMDRNKYLVMYSDSSNTVRWNYLRQKLTDRVVNKHISQESTIGVFSGNILTKFICFDIDSQSLDYSRYLCHMLLYTLQEEFHIPQENLVVSFSGKKGYHVEIFLSEAISLEIAESFYQTVMSFLHEETVMFGDIEFRPTNKQGVKLPLSINLDTQKVCWYVDNNTLEPIEDMLHILTLEPLDIGYFQYKVMDMVDESVSKKDFSLPHRKAVSTENLLLSTNPTFKTSEGFRDDCLEVLRENRLLRNHTRNNVTFQLAIILYEQGQDKQDTKDIISSVMGNTWENHRHLISNDTDYHYMMSEVDRIVNYVYKKGIFQVKETYKIYKSELLAILDLKTKTLQQLMLSLLIHSKKYAKKNGEFYMAYSVMGKMGNTSKRYRLLQYMLILDGLGYVTIVKRNTINMSMSKEMSKKENANVVISDTNVYKVNLNTIENDTFIAVKFSDTVELAPSVAKLVTENEAKKKLSKTQFYTTYKPYY